jgi:hypothetical protein
VGGLRPAMIAKYLPEFGWQPFIITRTYTEKDPRFNQSLDLKTFLDPEKIIRVPFSISDETAYLKSRKLSALFRDLIKPEYSSPPGLLDAVQPVAEEFLSKVKIDALLSTSPDQWELTLGVYLSKKFKIPLLADFRDIAEQEDGLKRSFREHFQRFRLTARRNLLGRQATEITTVSNFLAEKLRQKLKKNVTLVYNGFDEEIMNAAMNESALMKQRFNIVYIGRLLNLWYRDPSLLFEALSELIIEKKILGNEITIHFYGSEVLIINELLERFPDLFENETVKVHPQEKYSRIIEIIKSADLLLVLTNRGRKGILTTKFFEYLGINKRILSIPSDNDEIDKILQDTGSGVSFDNLEMLKAQIEEWIYSWRDGTYNSEIIGNNYIFSRKYQTKLFSEILDRVITKG